MSKKQKKSEPEVVGFVGLGFDNKDEHQRLTRTDHFFLVGGSQETHESMQETAIKFNEALEKRGKRLEETSIEEVIELLDESRP